ncbi:MAG TPA: STAS domain-containing protein [Ignavibacteriaceae bacterium]|jgi:anti-sigma B factor antagonist|nr:STAS domain-containing protein [Ignavibacteriaceae bacterium]
MNIKEQYGTVIIELKGKLVGGTLAGRMNRTLDNLLEQGKKNVVVDLSGITILNSSGMGILISGYRKMRDNGGLLKLANITNKIEGLLSITKLNQIFEIYSSADEAAESFNN